MLRDTADPTLSLSAVSEGTDIALDWSASDADSGLATCTLQYRLDAGDWQLHSQQCAGTETFDAQPGHTYTFRLSAADNVGNQAQTEAGAFTTAVTKYYYFGGKRVAMRNPDGVYYLHADHLGSTSLTTDESGAVVARQLYHPYGTVRWSEGTLPTDFGFTGQRAVPGSGLIFMHARYYHPYVGRFIQADTIVPSPGNPQHFNRYSYVSNNPLKFIDPGGHKECGPACEGEQYNWFEDLVHWLGQKLTRQGPRRIWSRSEEIQKAQAEAALKQQREHAAWSLYMWGFEAVGAFGGAYVGAQNAGQQQGNSRNWMPAGQAALLAGPSGTGNPQYQGTRSLPQPPLHSRHRNWVPWQTYVTGKDYEEAWLLSDGVTEVYVDAINNDYVVDAKYVGAFTEWGSPYHPSNKYYNEAKIIDQAWRQVSLAQELGLQGVRWAVNDQDAAGHFQFLFATYPATQWWYETGFLQVQVVLPVCE